MLSDLAAAHNKVKVSIIRTISVSLLLWGVVITGQQRDQKSTDGPISVKLGEILEKGEIKIDAADLTKLPTLPRGYALLPSMAYRITTDAMAVGPYTVVFGVASVTDEETFNSLRVLHAEPDEFDPDSAVWVDRTATEADASSPDFAHRTITAYSDQLEGGIYVIAKLTEKLSPSTATADVEVVAPPPPKVVQMPAQITTSVIVKNNGPATATDVGFKQQIPRGLVISMKPSQGTCKWKLSPGWVYCKLGQLPAGGSATIAVVIDPSGDFAGQYRSFVEVGGKEIDQNAANNRAVATADRLGDPNLPPEVTLESPEMEQLFEQGATVMFRATASDPDGSITKVEFLDNDRSLGIATMTDGKHFSLSSNQLANGRHVLNAIATDNGGRHTRSNAKHIFVNGPMKVRILEPSAETLITPGSDLTLTAEAMHPSRSIRSLEFFTVGISLGKATLIDGNRFTLKVSDVKRAKYSIEAIATDESGLISKSPRLELKVSNRPTVRIATPIEGTSLMTPVDIELILSPESPEYGRRVEVYANGVLIEQGSVFIPGKYSFTWKDAQAGKYELKAVLIDVIGVRGESSPVKLIIEDRNTMNR